MAGTGIVHPRPSTALSGPILGDSKDPGREGAFTLSVPADRRQQIAEDGPGDVLGILLVMPQAGDVTLYLGGKANVEEVHCFAVAVLGRSHGLLNQPAVFPVLPPGKVGAARRSGPFRSLLPHTPSNRAALRKLRERHGLGD